MTSITATICLLIGVCICLVASIGVLRLPDVFMRMHAATKAGVVGSGFILIAVAIEFATFSSIAKVTITILFLLLTTPVAGHALGRAAYISGSIFSKKTKKNELESQLERKKFLES